MGFDRAGGRVQVDLVQRAVVGRVFEQVVDGRRLAGHGRHADVVGTQARAGVAVDAAPDCVIVGHRRRAFGRRTAFAHAFILWGVGQQFGQTLAVPVVGPGQPGQRRQQISQQAPGAEHRVQVPIEAAALFAPVQRQPGTPARDLARPAQVQPGKAEKHQDQRAGAGDIAPGFADGQEAVQLQEKTEHVLTDGVAHVIAGVGIEVAHLATSLARWRGEEYARGVAAVAFHPEHRHALAFGGFELFHQFGGWQHAGFAFFHAEHRRVEGSQDFVLERHRRPGDPHQGQHQPGSDAEEPVQLEQGFLQHV